jgi:phosphatidylglycerophosphate synthase
VIRSRLERALGDYRRMAKPRAIEEVGDLYLIRPLGFVFVQGLRHLPVTPTMVSILAALAGWMSAWYYYQSQALGMVPWMAAVGALWVLVQSGLDSADGQLARLKSLHSPLGRIIDGVCDNLFFIAVYVAFLLGFAARSDHGVLLFWIGLVAGASHSIQGALVEYQRTLYLYAVHGKGDIAESEPEVLERSSDPSLVSRVLQFFHRGYWRQQRFWLRSTFALERAVIQWRHRHPERAAELAERYDRSHRRMLPWWSLVATNSHKLGIILAAFVPVSDASFWTSLGGCWLYFYTLALNLVLVVLIPLQARADRRLIAELDAR